MTLLDGKATADEIKLEIAAEVRKIIAGGGRRPHLAAILVGEDGASVTYVANKEKACKDVGFDSTVLRLPADISEEFLLSRVDLFNRNQTIDGFIVQLPLPKHIDPQRVINAIDPKKDVDGFHPENSARAAMGLPCYISATPLGVMTLLERYKIPTEGKHCVILGRSNIVGKPLSNLLSAKGYPGDCTVTVCHSKTPNPEVYTRQADILIAAVGIPHFVKADMVKEGATVIDVGITRVADDSPKGYKILGDVDFDAVAPKCGYISPVPGGVGKMTIISLLLNTLKAAKKQF